MRRREFIAFLGSTAAWPLVARAQQPERVRRVAVLMNTDSADTQTNYDTFIQSLQKLGWIDGQNVRLEARWAKGQASEIRKYAGELV